MNMNNKSTETCEASFMSSAHLSQMHFQSWEEYIESLQRSKSAEPFPLN
ncbi:12144_t:CDS:2 [Entrophospora sp. SA101]|nr:12144_t:CDS:2 [Entrophospora sp. SA101]